MTISQFIRTVLSIREAGEARAFFKEYVEELHKMPNAPKDPYDVARQNIGWCFGEGMPLETRGVWREACGAYHPVFGEMRSDPTFGEALVAAKKEVAAAQRKFTVPTLWARILKKNDDDSV